MSAVASTTPEVAHPRSPKLVVSSNGVARAIDILQFPFVIGRRPEHPLSLPHPAVSRSHAQIMFEDGAYYLEDLGSKLGTLVNNNPITRHRLKSGDRLQFGSAEVGTIVFSVHEDESAGPSSTVAELGIATGEPTSDLERLSLFLQAASRLNTSGLVEDILGTLVDSTLRLLRAERGFVFLRGGDGALRLAAAMDCRGNVLHGDETISHSILEKAASSGAEFIVTDASASQELSTQMSIVAFDLRTVVAIPLLHSEKKGGFRDAVLGVLYLDSTRVSQNLSTVSHDLLRTIAHQAAALIENAKLLQEREAKRRYEQELAISANIQQRLMSVNIPNLSFASVRALSTACRDIGGDFFDVVESRGQVACVVTDVCGKGVSAALLASILQGMIYAQLRSGLRLTEVVSVANEFLCERNLDSKYATLTIVRLDETGALEIVNCGHVPPFLIHNGTVLRGDPKNPPVGLFPGVTYSSDLLQLEPNDRLIIVTDGITEGTNDADMEFGEERVEAALQKNLTVDELIGEFRDFCGAVPQADDCTVLEVRFSPGAAVTQAEN